LAGFILDGVKYVGHYTKKKGKLFFNGYAPLNSASTRFYNAKAELDWLKSKQNELKEKNGSIIATSVPITAIAITEQGAVSRLVNLALGTTAGVALFLATIVSSSEGEKYFGVGEVTTLQQIDESQTVYPVAIPATLKPYTDLPIAIPTDITNNKPTDGDKCSVYVIWQTMATGDVEVSKYGITCQINPDGTQNCERPSIQCKEFNKNPDQNVLSYSYNWIVGGDTPNPVPPHVNYRTAIFIEKTMTALYLVNRIIANQPASLPPKHSLPCFKKEDPFDVMQSERGKRAQKWLQDAKSKY
jgi:hypothetical protein